MKLPKVPSKVTPTFSTKEVERLLAQPDRTKKHGFRDYTIMLVLVDTGARVSEIANLTVNDADIENGHLRVTGKGGKERHIPFGYKVAKALLKYKLKYRGEPAGNDRFFLSNGGRPISVGRIERVCRRYGEMAGLERCYPHKAEAYQLCNIPQERRGPLLAAEKTGAQLPADDQALLRTGRRRCTRRPPQVRCCRQTKHLAETRELHDDARRANHRLNFK